MQIGIIGGGQLAMMLCEAAKKLNIKTVVLDPNEKCSSSYICDQLITSNYDDKEGLDKLARICDVVTYEFENVSVAGLESVNDKYHNVVQGTTPLKLANDRLHEKEQAAISGFKPVAFASVSCNSDITRFAKSVEYPLVLKTRKFGYDGKGQRIINDESDLDSLEVINILKQGAIIEKMVNLDYETSVIAIRNSDGQIRFIPSTNNVHMNNILFSSEVSADSISNSIIEKVKSYINYHDLIGIITVEVFVDIDGEVYFNEIAPRPHNSGHYSIEGCDHSQFDMHIRSICGIDLPDIKLIDHSFMVNILGQDYEFAKQWYEINKCSGIVFHDYWKQGAINNRKMAHITAVGSNNVKCLKKYSVLAKERNE